MRITTLPLGQAALMLGLFAVAWVAIRLVGRRVRRSFGAEPIAAPQAGRGLDEATVLRAAESLGAASMVSPGQLAAMSPREREMFLMTLVGKAAAAKRAERVA